MPIRSAGDDGAVGDRPQRDHEPDQLDRRQRLAKHDPPERRAGDRRSQAEQRRRHGREMADAVEPEHEGQRRADQAEIGEPGEVASGQRCGCALEDGCERHEDRPTNEQLPSRCGQPVARRRKALGEHHSQCERRVGTRGGKQTDGVESAAGTDHDQPDSDGGDSADRHVQRSRSPTGDRPREEGHEQRLQPAGRRRNSPRQPVHGRRQEWKEQTEVDHREETCATPFSAPRPPSWTPGADDEEHDTRGKNPHRAHEQWPSVGEQLGDRDVARPPRDRC
jgi:hypothetical protein